MEKSDQEHDEISEARRELLKAIAAGSGAIAARALLPAVWSAPIVAATALPAHASMSNPNSQSTEPPAGSVMTMGSGPNGVAITAVVSTGKVTLTINPPNSVITARTQFQVCERLDDTKVTPAQKFVRVVSLMAPSADAAFSGSYTLALSRARGTYEYQLRWDGGHTAWVSATVTAA